MPNFGLSTIPAHYTISPAELGRWLEAHGFESVWFGEHSHIPVSRETDFIVGGELPEYYKHFFDPFIGLTAVAAVTERLRIGTAICVVTEHHPINLAKMVSCLDHVSNGRFLFGIGAGWNAEELADYGVDFKQRWKVTRESVLAMRQIWGNEEAKFYGDYVKFPPMWCWPKPVQPGGPPVLMGAYSKFVPARVAEYCDGWIPIDLGIDLEVGLAAVRSEVESRGRSVKDIIFSVLMNLQTAGSDSIEHRVHELLKLGFERIVFRLPTDLPARQWPILDYYARLVRKFNSPGI